MSWKASAYVKNLTTHGDGTRLSAREKLILFVLADSHNEELDCAWIGIKKAAVAALTSRSRFIELVNRLEARGTIQIERRQGNSSRYIFHNLPVQESDHHLSRNRTTTRPTATGRGGPIATGPKPLSNHQESKPKPTAASRPSSIPTVEKEENPAAQRKRFAEIGRLAAAAMEIRQAHPGYSDGDLVEALKTWAARHGITYFDAWPGAATPIEQAITIANERRKSA